MTMPRFDGTQACAGADIDLFFPPAGHGATAAVRQAKELCANCGFLDACLEYSVWAQGAPGRYVDGVWGGTTTAERAQIRHGIREAA